MTLRAHLGRSTGDTPLTPTGDYRDWQLGADLSWRNLTLGIAYVDTDLTTAAASAGATKDVVDGAIVLSLGAAF